MKNSTLNKWKSAYEKREVMPSGDLWSQLEEKLDGQPERSQKQFLKWCSYAAALFLIFSVGSLIYLNSAGSVENKADALAVTKIRKDTANQARISLPDQRIPQENIETAKEAHLLLTVQKSNRMNDIVPGIPIAVMDADRQPDNHGKEAEQAEVLNTIAQQQDLSLPTTGNPLIAEGKKQDPGYIHADELLLGREIDRLNETRDLDERKFGVFNLKKVVPKVEKVTVLGVKVYIDPK